MSLLLSFFFFIVRFLSSNDFVQFCNLYPLLVTYILFPSVFLQIRHFLQSGRHYTKLDGLCDRCDFNQPGEASCVR